MAKLTKAEAIEHLDKLADLNTGIGGDAEEAHDAADKILLAYVPKKVADAWCRVEKSVHGFWYS